MATRPIDKPVKFYPQLSLVTSKYLLLQITNFVESHDVVTLYKH